MGGRPGCNRRPQSIGHADVAQTRAAVEVAHAAFSSWQYSPIQQRFEVLDQVGTELLARREELGQQLSREEGKTRAEGIAEVARAGYVFKFFAGEALRHGGELLPSVRPGVTVEVTREPVGPVAIITPWNFPVAIPAWKIAPALCYGNTVVFKPAELVPASAWALAEIIARTSLPKGVFNLVMGRGSVVGDVLVNAAEIRAITFTGSVATGSAIAASAVTRRAKLQLEMGGKNPLVILDDADLATAVNVAVNGAYFSTGQRCTASSRLIVTDGIYARFLAALSERVAALRIGHAPTRKSARWWTSGSWRSTSTTSRSAVARERACIRAGGCCSASVLVTISSRRCSPIRPRACASTRRKSSVRWRA
jgi:alpha-ketoglutaric semialdehyde dehydrogenase